MSKRSREGWGADTAISHPTPISKENPPLVEMGGFAMGVNGIMHSVTSDDLENILRPTYAPEGFYG